jgi:hypothetical protein
MHAETGQVCHGSRVPGGGGRARAGHLRSHLLAFPPSESPPLNCTLREEILRHRLMVPIY